MKSVCSQAVKRQTFECDFDFEEVDLISVRAQALVFRTFRIKIE